MQFENLVFVIMSTRENTRLIARASYVLYTCTKLNVKKYITKTIADDKKHAKGLSVQIVYVFYSADSIVFKIVFLIKVALCNKSITRRY